jgi:hypothetical protein
MFETQVAKGAAFLDERMPNWLIHINKKSLRMADTRQCVLGQTIGWSQVCEEVRESRNSHEVEVWLNDHGFRTGPFIWREDDETMSITTVTQETLADYDVLTKEWLVEIEKRERVLV